jgi:hypothetical protein
MTQINAEIICVNQRDLRELFINHFYFPADSADYRRIYLCKPSRSSGAFYKPFTFLNIVFDMSMSYVLNYFNDSAKPSKALTNGSIGALNTPAPT